MSEVAGCGQCRFYGRDEDDDEFGVCRRYAPRPTTEGGRARWPGVESDEWCGEFERKPSTQPVVFAS